LGIKSTPLSGSPTLQNWAGFVLCDYFLVYMPACLLDSFLALDVLSTSRWLTSMHTHRFAYTRDLTCTYST